MDIRYFGDVERDDLIAELWDGDLNWGQITIDRTTGKFTLEIFISMDGATKAFDLQEVQVTLERAEHRLLELEIQRLFPSKLTGKSAVPDADCQWSREAFWAAHDDSNA